MALDVGRVAADTEIDTELNVVPTDSPEPVERCYRRKLGATSTMQKQSIQPFSDAKNLCSHTLSMSDRKEKKNPLNPKHSKLGMPDLPNATLGNQVQSSEKHVNRKCLQQECLKFKEKHKDIGTWKEKGERPPWKLVGIASNRHVDNHKRGVFPSKNSPTVGPSSNQSTLLKEKRASSWKKAASSGVPKNGAASKKQFMPPPKDNNVLASKKPAVGAATSDSPNLSMEKPKKTSKPREYHYISCPIYDSLLANKSVDPQNPFGCFYYGCCLCAHIDYSGSSESNDSDSERDRERERNWERVKEWEREREGESTSKTESSGGASYEYLKEHGPGGLPDWYKYCRFW
ncbi:unnamed protein product [Cuscuta epithymum]|uniref:Uncharacterized protein n=1 Tax=Cuscuta epithymum TaxID=186058 RepID=A0AAV0BZU5_9ASTE|nr:unnamed protein product [Cuscuta epithymum]